MKRTRRPSPQTAAVVLALADGSGWSHGYDLCKQLRLKAGTVYPILMRLHERGLVHLMTLKHAQVAIVEATVEEGAPVAGRPLSELDIPDNVVVSAVLRDGALLLPKGDTVLQPDDEVIALANRENEEAFREMMTGD